MAEFQEVIIQMKRMCDHFRPTCNGCPLCLKKGTNEFCGEQPKDIRSHPALVEAAVMRWAAEHPEPVYPTWSEWLYEQGVLGDKYVCNIPALIASNVATDKVNDPIPADIAQKLGIEPKEG